MFKRNKNNEPIKASEIHFDHIDCKRISEGLELFKENERNCDIYLGFYTIDIKCTRVYQSTDPANEE